MEETLMHSDKKLYAICVLLLSTIDFSAYLKASVMLHLQDLNSDCFLVLVHFLY